MNCERARERMMEWMDGRLDPATAADIKAHVDGCAGCQQELAAIRRMALALDAPAPAPSPALRRNVFAAIEAEKYAATGSVPASRPPARRPGGARAWRLGLAQAFGACALLAVGFLVGERHAPAPATGLATQQQLAALQSRIDNVGTVVGLTLRQEQQAPTNQRLQAVYETAARKTPDQNAIDSLIGTLALDPSANVRLSAVQALYGHADQEVVRTAVGVSLPREQSPLVQLAMIDFLTAARDHDARPVLEKLAGDAAADSNVRDAAARALSQL